MASAGKRQKLSANSIKPQSVEKSSEFADGAIVRMKLENFVTYDSVEFTPGPHLNVIIGPNATGKSSIVCAICLGLGGKTSILGRAQQPVEFVKHGAQKAVIEIHLHNPHADGDTVVRREISRVNNSSSWTVNGQPASQKAVDDLTRNRKIQVGNLCQFLPQDKVADFAKMTEQELLENTQKAVAIDNMHENHVKLKLHRENEKKFLSEKKHLEEKLEREEAVHSRQQQDVENYKTRQLYLEKVQLLNSKKPWVEYEEQRKKFKAEKEKKDEILKRLKEIQKENAPQRERLERAKETEKQMNIEMTRKQTELKDQAGLVVSSYSEIDKKTEKQEEERQKFTDKKECELTRRRRVQEHEAYIRDLKEELDKLISEDSEDVGPLLKTTCLQITDVSKQLTSQQHQADELLAQIDRAKREITDVQNRLRKIQDVHNKRLEVLKQHKKDAYTAVQWLRANKDKFRSTIHEPIMIVMTLILCGQLSVKDPTFAAYIESHVSYQDFFTFVCEDSDDQDLFLKSLRMEQDLRINTVLLPNKVPKSFTPKKPLSEYRRFGFHHYLSEMFDCPPGVMAYLCIQYNVHNIPVGNEQTQQNKEAVLESCPELHSFFTQNHKNAIRRSKYGAKHRSCMMSALKRSNLLSRSSDAEQENRLKQELQRAEENKKILEMEKNSMKIVLQKLEVRLNELHKEKKRLKEKASRRLTLEQKIKSKEDSIRNLEKQAVNLDEEEAQTDAKIRQIECEKLQVLQKFKKLTQKCLNLSIEKVKLSLCHATALREASVLSSLLRDQATAQQNLETKLEEQTAIVKETRDYAKRLHVQAKSAVNLRPDQDPSPELQAVFDSLPGTLKAINEAIHDVQSRADCTIHTDSRVVEEYERREQTINQLKRDLRKVDNELSRYRQTIEEVKVQWLTPLKELLSKINRNYSEFFRSIGCAGEVELNVPNNPEDYDRYGIRIKVKFRDSEQLRELNAHHQSGGERSVSTVLYMMALQELTKVPFRCVDEINQGMDPHNERKVFELVMKTACRKNTSQYFLLTPKLLPDLEYDDNVTVMCVCNGPNMLSHKDWNRKRFIRRCQRLNSLMS